MINKHGRLDLNEHGVRGVSETDSLPRVGRQELICDDERIPGTTRKACHIEEETQPYSRYPSPLYII